MKDNAMNYVFRFIVLFLFVIAVAVYYWSGYDIRKNIEMTAVNFGFSHIQVGDFNIWGCRKNEGVGYHFTALNIEQKRVAGTACCDQITSCTLRF
jgi:hypothetical protein